MDISDERALVRARRAEIEYLVHEMSLFESHFNPFTTQVRKNSSEIKKFYDGWAFGVDWWANISSKN